MKIFINLMRFQEASGIFINSSAKDTQKSFSFFFFNLRLFIYGWKQQKKERTTRFEN
jgi:uncharacterized membrane-anchored protein YitT (DUF2179 family)